MIAMRPDLEVVPAERNGRRTYRIRAGADAFEFGEEDYFLYEAVQARSAPAEIARAFHDRFGKPIAEADVRAFAEEMVRLGIGHPVDPPSPPSAPSAPAAARASGRGRRRRPREGGGGAMDAPVGEGPMHGQLASAHPAMPEEMREEEDEEEGAGRGEKQFPLLNPTRFFQRLAAGLGWVRPLRWPLAIIILIGGGVAGWLLFTRPDAIAATQTASALPYLGKLMLTLLSLNLIRCLVQGTVLAGSGASIPSAGVKLRFNLVPRFYINRTQLRDLDRSKRMWCYAATILSRLAVMATGALLWLGFLPTNPALAGFGLLLLQGGFIGLLLVTIPLRTSDGFRWMAACFGWPDNLVRQALQITGMMLRGRRPPGSLSRALWLVVYAVVIVVAWTAFLIFFASHLAEGLGETFPDLFGRATEFLLLGIFLLIIGRWLQSKVAGRRRGAAEGEVRTTGSAWRWIWTGAAIALLFVPFPYRPGGPCTLLPPVQQPLQILESGIVETVYHRGGDGTVLEAGTVVATLRSPSLDAEMGQTREQLRVQRAALAREEALLRALRGGAREEELDAARARMERAKAQVEAGEAALEAARIGEEFALKEVAAFEPLAAQGAYASLMLEDKRRKARLATVSIGETGKALEAARRAMQEAEADLALMEAGAHPEEIIAAEQTVAGIEAEIAKLQANLDYLTGQQAALALTMPFTGLLVDAHLDRKRGARMELGQVFATLQEPGLPRVEVALPESEAGDIALGARASVRLLAHPQRTLGGVVESIEPAASSGELSHTVHLLVTLEEVDPAVTLKAGMTGFCKVDAGFAPLGLLLARPLIRFFQVEVWSWLP